MTLSLPVSYPSAFCMERPSCYWELSLCGQGPMVACGRPCVRPLQHSSFLQQDPLQGILLDFHSNGHAPLHRLPGSKYFLADRTMADTALTLQTSPLLTVEAHEGAIPCHVQGETLAVPGKA